MSSARPTPATPTVAASSPPIRSRATTRMGARITITASPSIASVAARRTATITTTARPTPASHQAGAFHTGIGGCCNNDGECADTDLCTSAEHCVAHACASTVVICNDHNDCTDDSCDPQAGCQYVNNDNPCDDHDVCTPSDRCTGGSCVGTGEVDCDDHNGCTDDECVHGSAGGAFTGCQHAQQHGPVHRQRRLYGQRRLRRRLVPLRRSVWLRRRVLLHDGHLRRRGGLARLSAQPVLRPELLRDEQRLRRPGRLHGRRLHQSHLHAWARGDATRGGLRQRQRR